MKRSGLRLGSLSRRGSAGRLATAYRTARGFQMNVVDEPAAAVRADDVERHHLIAIVALQLDPVGTQVVASRHEERPFNDAIACMIEILLNDGEALAQYFRIHRPGGGPAFGAPQLAHPFLILGFYRGQKLGDRLVHRLRDRRSGARVLAAADACQEKEIQREPSLHERTPRVRTNRR